MSKSTNEVIYKGQKVRIIYVMGGAATIRKPDGEVIPVRADKLRRPEDFR